MPLWGASDSDESKPKNLTTAEKKEVYATGGGWVREAGSIWSGNDNANADPEVLVAISNLSTSLGAADITGVEWITSTADKEVAVILAEANKNSEIMKGEGDGQRNKIFAEAFGRDPEFFAFYRAMQAYERALIGGDTSLVLSPDSEFFKFFGNIKPKSE